MNRAFTPRTRTAASPPRPPPWAVRAPARPAWSPSAVAFPSGTIPIMTRACCTTRTALSAQPCPAAVPRTTPHPRSAWARDPPGQRRHHVVPWRGSGTRPYRPGGAAWAPRSRAASGSGRGWVRTHHGEGYRPDQIAPHASRRQPERVSARGPLAAEVHRRLARRRGGNTGPARSPLHSGRSTVRRAPLPRRMRPIGRPKTSSRMAAVKLLHRVLARSPGSTFCAVDVLLATCGPGIAAFGALSRRPVPRWRKAVSISAHARRRRARRPRDARGRRSADGVALRVADVLDEERLEQLAAVGDRAHAMATRASSR